MKFKADDYVLTSKGKLGKVLLPGYMNHQEREYRPASVQLNTKVYQIWEENLELVELVAIKVMGETTPVVLKARTAFNLIQILLRNRISVKIDIEETKELNVFTEQTRVELPEFIESDY